jgi:hypothetical protein
MHSVQESGGLSEGERQRIVEEELLRARVRRDIESQELMDEDRHERARQSSSVKTLLLILGAVVLVGVVLLLIPKAQDLYQSWFPPKAPPARLR